MAELFDQYRVTYNRTVDNSISFSGLRHDFFLQAKLGPLANLIAERGLARGGSGVRALDVGCGIGALHPYVKPLFSDLQGCDISTESIARARDENPGITYTAYSAPRLPYADATFDLAFAVCVAHHVPPDQWSSFFSEMRRVVRPGGVVSVIEHNPFNPLTRLAVLRCPFDEDAILISRRKAARLLEAAGLTEIEGRHFLTFPFSNPVARKLEGWFSACRLERNMCAAAVSDIGSGLQPAKRPVRFLIIGLGATVLYALLATMFSTGRTALMPPASGSVFSYVIAAVFSYAGHKYFTFASNGAHSFEAPRFFVLTLLGLAVSFVLPAVLSGILGLRAQIPIVLTCILIPVVNYAVLRNWVFTSMRNNPG